MEVNLIVGGERPRQVLPEREGGYAAALIAAESPLLLLAPDFLGFLLVLLPARPELLQDEI